MSERIAEVIEGFEMMDVSQLTFNRYLVTSWRNAETNGHVVDLSEPNCSCEDMAYNNEGEEVCAHVIKANHVAESRADTSEHVLRFLSQEAQAVQQAAESIEQTATSMEAYQQSGGSETASQPADEEEGDEIDDPVARFEEILRDRGLDPDAFNVYVDDQYGSLQIDQEGYLEDGEFQAWVDLSDDLEMGYDRGTGRNYIEPDRFPEVLG